MRRTWERANAHHSQFPAIPRRATRPVTYNGVSTLKVVAAIEVPASHQRSDRPLTKKSTSPPLARRESQTPTARVIPR
jgi:hypothetical protein